MTPALPPVMLREASADDCAAVWRWMAPEAPAPSVEAAVIAFAEHAAWFATRIANHRAPVWIVEMAAGPVGVVQLEGAASGLTRIAIAIAPAVRGRGIGRCAVTAACQRWDRPMFAEIFADNLASRACFEACGFRAVVECDGLLTYHWDPET